MIKEKKWEEFRKAGLLGWINMQLHLFGYAIVVENDEDTGEFIRAFPARVRFRGFEQSCQDEIYKGVTEYMSKEIGSLSKDMEVT